MIYIRFQHKYRIDVITHISQNPQEQRRAPVRRVAHRKSEMRTSLTFDIFEGGEALLL